MIKQIFEKSIHTSIIINSPRDKVWGALSDFSTYQKWNTLVPSASGNLSSGSYLEVLVSLPQSKTMHYQVKITKVQKTETLQWLGHYKFPGLFDGHHRYHLKALDSHCTELIHEETFRGILVFFVWGYLKPKFIQRFNEANTQVKFYVDGVTYVL